MSSLPIERSASFTQTDFDEVFRVYVANPPAYTSFAIKKNNVTLGTWQLSANDPVASISGITANQLYDGDDTINLTLTSSDQDGDSISYQPFYSTDGGETYIPLSLIDFDTSTATTQIPVNAGKLVGSATAKIGMVVSDGLRSVFVESVGFKNTDHNPDVWINSPFPNTYLAGQNMLLEATGYDLENGFLTFDDFQWESNVDGNLGVGSWLHVSSDDLTNGEHIITVTGTDRSGNKGTASVTITSQQGEFHSYWPPMIPASVELMGDVTIDVMANDTDTENDVRSLTIVSEPFLGVATVVVASDGGMEVEYMGHTSGRDTFEYEICDFPTRCDTAMVSVSVGLANCTIIGTEGDDTLTGTEGDDVICGLGGNDFIEGRAGNDIILGGTGNDRLYGRLGDDTIRGEIGNDYILGHRGADIMYGGVGDDTIYGAEDDDTIYGEHGADKLYGQIGSDTIEGGQGDDLLRGGKGDDTIRGGPGDDNIRGNAGMDVIYGGTGVDTFLGVSVTDDTIIDDTDADSMDMGDDDDDDNGAASTTTTAVTTSTTTTTTVAPNGT